MSCWNPTVFLKSITLPFQIQRDWTVLLQYSKFQCSTIFSLSVISKTQTLVGLCAFRSLINTNDSIPALKTLCARFSPDSSSCDQKGLGARLDTNDQFMCCPSYLCLNCTSELCLSLPLPSSSPDVFISRLNDYRPSNRKWDLSRLAHFEKNFYHEQRIVTSRSDVC